MACSGIEGDGIIYADPRLVRIKIDNVLSNAFIHNVPNGWVRVVVHSDADRTWCVVSNSGPHIAPEQLDRLTEPLYRVRSGQSLIKDVEEADEVSDGGGADLWEPWPRFRACSRACDPDEQGAELTLEARPEGGLTVTMAWSTAQQAGADTGGHPTNSADLT